QCVTWGHPVTTGLGSLDYFVSSELFENAEADAQYRETLVRLKGMPYFSYRPPPPVPRDRAYFTLPEDAHLYGCPQSLFKLHPDFDCILGDILRRDPAGILVLNQSAFAHYRHWEEILRQRFATSLADVSRQIRFLPRLN